MSADEKIQVNANKIPLANSDSKSNKRGKFDYTFLTLVLLLLTTGLIMLFSASMAHAHFIYNNSYHFITRQAAFAIVGVVIMLFVSRVDYHFYEKFRLPWIVYGVSIIMLIIVLFMKPFQEGFDYKRWISLGIVSFQPSEVAKFAIILLFSYLISRNYSKMKTFKYGILPYMFLLMGVCVLVVVEPHLSATIVIFLLGAALMVVGGIRLRWVLAGLGIGVGGVAIAILTGIVSYGSDRIAYWLDPWADAMGKGYQTIQSLLAIGSGGFFGVGLGQSRQKHLWLPEPHNDFIFSIVCEELGFFGALIIVALFALLIWRGFVIAKHSKDKFGSLLVIGLVFQIGIQTALNLLVVTNTIPNTGISLPFFSYGGTALLMLLAQMGIVLSVSRSSNIKKN